MSAFNTRTATCLLALLSFVAAEASAATIRVTCEKRATRSKASVDGNNLPAGVYTTEIVSGGNMARSPATPTVGDEIETDFDSRRGDIAEGATAIVPGFIVGRTLTGKIIDSSGNTVISDTVSCRVRR